MITQIPPIRVLLGHNQTRPVIVEQITVVTRPKQTNLRLGRSCPALASKHCSLSFCEHDVYHGHSQPLVHFFYLLCLACQLVWVVLETTLVPYNFTVLRVGPTGFNVFDKSHYDFLFTNYFTPTNNSWLMQTRIKTYLSKQLLFDFQSAQGNSLQGVRSKHRTAAWVRINIKLKGFLLTTECNNYEGKRIALLQSCSVGIVKDQWLNFLSWYDLEK